MLKVIRTNEPCSCSTPATRIHSFISSLFVVARDGQSTLCVTLMNADCLVLPTELDACVSGESSKALHTSSSTASPLTVQSHNHAVALNSSPLFHAGRQPLQVDGFASPSTSRAYPISPNMSDYLRTRREQFFLNARNGTRRRAQEQAESHTSARTTAEPSRRTGPHVNPFVDAASNSTVVDQNESSRMMRQQFRRRCQAAMERDRQRDRQRRLQGVRSGVVVVQQSSSPTRGRSTDIQDGDTSFSELDVPSSDIDTTTWEAEEDDEMIRRIMTAEYRRLLREQERQGEREVGWLDPDEVAWLQEEMRREEALGLDVQPPPELEDEDEILCAMYEEAHRHTASSAMTDDFSSSAELDDYFSWVHDVNLDYDMAEDRVE